MQGVSLSFKASHQEQTFLVFNKYWSAPWQNTFLYGNWDSKKKKISIFLFSKASHNKYQNDASQSCLLWKLLRANNKLSLKPLIGTIHFLFSPKIPPKPFCDPRIFQDFLDNINIDYFLANLLSWYLNYIIDCLNFYRTRVRSLVMLVSNWLTDWLTHSLPFSKLYWCDPGIWCQLKTCWGCYGCGVHDENHVGNSLLQIWKLGFGHKA